MGATSPMSLAKSSNFVIWCNGRELLRCHWSTGIFFNELAIDALQNGEVLFHYRPKIHQFGHLAFHCLPRNARYCHHLSFLPGRRFHREGQTPLPDRSDSNGRITIPSSTSDQHVLAAEPGQILGRVTLEGERVLIIKHSLLPEEALAVRRTINKEQHFSKIIPGMQQQEPKRQGDHSISIVAASFAAFALNLPRSCGFVLLIYTSQ